MSVTSVMVARPASDIEEEIRHEIIRAYDIVKQSRDYFTVTADETGHVTAKGNVRSVQAHRLLVDGIPDIKGVQSFEATELYDDDTLRFIIGKLLPHGVIVRVNFGYVVLTGNLPAQVDSQTLVDQVSKVAGVRKVIAQFF